MKVYNYLPKEPRLKSCSLSYSSKFGGYVSEPQRTPLKVAVTTQDEYFRYLAGERTHLFPEYDPKTHTTQEDAHPAEVWFENVPVVLYSRSSSDRMPYGVYRLDESDYKGNCLIPCKVNLDAYIDIGRKTVDLYQDFSAFRNEREMFFREKKRHRSSTLLYGAPGNGKSREIGQVIQQAEPGKFYVIMIGSDVSNLSSLEDFRGPLEGEDVVFVLEEITERANSSDRTDQLLSFLDGEMSWNHCYVIATTNYPEELAGNIIDRPGRFRHLIEISAPNESERLTFLLSSGVEGEVAREAARVTRGLSLDYLNCLIFEHKRTGKSFAEIFTDMKAIRSRVAKSFKSGLGLNSGSGG